MEAIGPYPSKYQYTRLDVAAQLAYRMTLHGMETVAQETQVSVAALLEMVEGIRAFNRRVLRYLGVVRVNRYWYAKR